MFTIWQSTAEFADFVIANTILSHHPCQRRTLVESDAAKPRHFHAIPTHLKQILYLDAPDLIIEYQGVPILALEVSTEAGTGHNVFQRFGRLAAAAERGVPVFYIYPEAVYVERQNSARYDRLNPLIYHALERLMQLFNVPCLMYHYPSGFPDRTPPFPGGNSKGLVSDPTWPSCPASASPEMRRMFSDIDTLLSGVLQGRALAELMMVGTLRERRDFIAARAYPPGFETMSPLSATTVVSTTKLLAHLRERAGPNHDFGFLLPSRPETYIYVLDARFRGDPYPGALAAIDYIRCRTGKTYEDRQANLAIAWGRVESDDEIPVVLRSKGQSIEDFMGPIRDLYQDQRRVLLGKSYRELRSDEISRYYMQVRFGTTFSKRKDIRMYSYFADAILFPDGALWREG